MEFLNYLSSSAITFEDLKKETQKYIEGLSNNERALQDYANLLQHLASNRHYKSLLFNLLVGKKDLWN